MVPGDVVRGRPNPRHWGLPDRLKRARGKDLSRRKLAALAGTSNAVISAIENNATVPVIGTIERIARALQVSPCTLAYGVDVPFAASTTLQSEGAGHRLASARTARGLSRNALGQLAGLSHTTLGNIEAGRTLPTVASAEALAKALRVSPCWLSYGEGEMELPPKPRRRKSPADAGQT